MDHANGKRRLGEDKTGAIIEYIQKNSDSSNAAIARTFDVDRKTITKIKKVHDEDIHGPFYIQRLKDISANDYSNVKSEKFMQACTIFTTT